MLLCKWGQRITPCGQVLPLSIHTVEPAQGCLLPKYKYKVLCAQIKCIVCANTKSPVLRLDYAQANTLPNNGLCKQDKLHPPCCPIYLPRITLSDLSQ